MCGIWLRLGCAGCAVTGPPEQWRWGAGKARRVARKDASQLAASAWTHCQPTPGAPARSRRAGARRPLLWGALSFGYFSLSTQRKVTRSPEASEKRQGCRATKERALEHMPLSPHVRRQSADSLDHPNTKGSERKRLPVSANTAFATAGAIGGNPGSPTPPILSVLSTICTSTLGISSIRSTT